MANYFDRYDSPEETPEIESPTPPLPEGTRFDVRNAPSALSVRGASDIPNAVIQGAVNQGILSSVEGGIRAGTQLGSAIGSGIVERNILGDEYAKLGGVLGQLQRDQMMGESPQRAKQIEQVQSRMSEIEAKAAPALAGARSVGSEGLKPLAAKVGEARKAVEERFPITPEFQKSFGGAFIMGLGQAAGQLPMFMVPGLGPASSIGQLYQQGYDDAKGEGADDATAEKAGAANVPAAALDYVADKSILGRFLKSIKGKMTVGDLLKSTAASSLTEGMTEALQQYWQNFVANTLVKYDEDREIDDQVIDSFLLGAAIGGTVHAVGSTVGATRAPEELPATTPQPVPGEQATAGMSGEQPAPAATRIEIDPEVAKKAISGVEQQVTDWQAENEGAPQRIRVIYDPNLIHNELGVRGAFTPKGEILVNAAYAKDPQTVNEVLNHEWAHYTVSTEEGKQALVQFSKNAIPKEELAELSRRYRTKNELELVDEWIAKNAERAPGVIAQIVQQVREWLFKVSNGKIKLTPQQAARVLLRTLREQQTGQPQPQTQADTAGGATTETAPQYSLTDERPINTYSQLARTLLATPEKASRGQIEAALREGVKEKGQLKERPVKAEEMADVRDTSGLSFADWLKQNPDATRQQMIEFAQQNEVRPTKGEIPEAEFVVREGGQPVKTFKTAEEADAYIEKMREWWQNEYKVTDRGLIDPNGELIYRIEPEGDNFVVSDPNGFVENERFSSLEKAKKLLDLFARNESSNYVDRYAVRETPGPEYAEGSLVLPGGRNQRETILKIPGSQYPYSEFKGHFSSHRKDVRDAFAHIRSNDRLTPEGDRVHFIEEIQSDLHQEGRKKGYGIETPQQQEERKNALFELRDRLETVRRELRILMDDMSVHDRSPDATADTRLEMRNQFSNKVRERYDLEQQIDRLLEIEDKVPDAPFKKSWHELAFKHALDEAVKSGANYLAWTTGKQQADRYNLTNYLDKVVYTFNKETGKYDIAGEKGDYEVFSRTGIAPDKLAEFIGQETADKIEKRTGLQLETDHESSGILSGLNLEVGGEGMKGFYDRILPQFAEKYLKKYGVKPEDIKVSELSEPVHAIRITPEMRESIRREGQPRYSLTEQKVQPLTVEQANKGLEDGKLQFTLKRLQSPEFKGFSGDWQNDPENASKVVDANGRPRLMFHGTTRPQDFTVFNTKNLSAGAHFAEEPAVASSFARAGFVDEAGARVIPVYLDIRNPWRSTDLMDWTSDKVIREWASQHDQSVGSVTNEFNRVIGDEGLYSENETVQIQAFLKSKGYDGIVYLNRFELYGPGEDSIPAVRYGKASQFRGASDMEFKQAIPEATDAWIAFDPSQIKSATGNVGSYGQRPVTAEEAARVGMTENEANRAQRQGDIRFSLTPEQVEAIDQKNIRDLDVESLIETGVLTPRRGQLLDALRKVHDIDVPIRVVDASELPSKAAGAYDPKTNEILINRDAKSNLGRVLLHEYTHALTLEGLRYADEAINSRGETVLATPRPGVTPEQLREASRQMDDLFSKAKDAADEAGSKFYGLNSREEFVAEAFSSKKFQDFLSSIPSTGTSGQSLFDRFVSIVKNVLGLGDESLLTDVIRATDAFVGAKKEVRGNLMAEDEGTRFSLTEEPERKVIRLGDRSKQRQEAADLLSQFAEENGLMHIGAGLWAGDNAQLELKPGFGREWNLAFIGTRPEDRGKGYASDLLSRITDFADKNNLPIKLIVEPTTREGKRGLNADQLQSWYERNGFTLDEGSTDKMTRLPQGSEIRYSLTPEKVQEKQMSDTTVEGPLKADEDGFIPVTITPQGALPTVVIGVNGEVDVPFVSFNQYANTVFKSRSRDPEYKGREITLADAHIPVIQEYYSGLSRETYREKNVEKATDMVVNDMAENLLFLHDFAVEAFGKDVVKRMSMWYDGANKIAGRFGDKYDITINQSAAMLAAFSPQKHWFANVSLAENVMDILTNHQDTVFGPAVEKAAREAVARSDATPKSKAKLQKLIDQIRGKQLSEIEDIREAAVFVRFLSEAIHPEQAYIVTPEGKLTPGSSEPVAWSGTGTTVNAIRAFLDGSNETLTRAIGGGHKVRNFFGNILSPMSPLFYTSDTHNVAASLLIPVGGSDFEVGHNFGTNPKLELEEGAEPSSRIITNIEDLPKLPVMGTTITGLQGTYPLYVEAGRRAAEQRGILPRQMQSITWEMIRIMFTDDMKTDKFMIDVKGVHAGVRKGKLSLPDARQKIVELSGGIESIKDRPPEWLNR